jgi:hypothetical protein
MITLSAHSTILNAVYIVDIRQFLFKNSLTGEKNTGI